MTLLNGPIEGDIPEDIDIEMRTCTSSASDMMMSIDDEQNHISLPPTGPGMLTTSSLVGLENARISIARWLQRFEPYATSRSRPPSLSRIPSVSDIDIEASSLVSTNNTPDTPYILNDKIHGSLRFGDVSRTILRRFLKETKSHYPTRINMESIREDIDRYLTRWYIEKCFDIYAGLAIINPSATITLGDVGRLVGVGNFVSFFNIHNNLHTPPGTEDPLFPIPPQADVAYLAETFPTGYNCNLDQVTGTRATLAIAKNSTRILFHVPLDKRRKRSWPEWERNTALLKGFVKVYGPRFYELVRNTRGLDIEDGTLLLIVSTVGAQKVTQFLSVSKSASSDIAGDEWQECDITSQPCKAAGGSTTVCEDNDDCHIIRRFGWAPEEANSIQVTHINVIPLPKTSG